MCGEVAIAVSHCRVVPVGHPRRVATSSTCARGRSTAVCAMCSSMRSSRRRRVGAGAPVHQLARLRTRLCCCAMPVDGSRIANGVMRIWCFIARTDGCVATTALRNAHRLSNAPNAARPRWFGCRFSTIVG